MIKVRKTGIVLIIQIFCFSLFGQNVKIYGNAPAYAGEEIEFFVSPNPVTRFEESAGKCNVDNNGNFNCELNIKKTCRIDIPLGIYRGYFYARPGNRYELALPLPKKKTEEQKLNPYFSETDIHLGILNEDKKGLNYLVRKFDETFRPLLNVAAIKAYTHKSADYISFIDKLNKLEDSTSNIFYNNYKKYSIKLLQMVSSGYSSKKRNLFSFAGLPLDYNNPSFITLFNQVFHQYFSSLGRSKNGQRIYTDINRTRNYTGLLETVKNDLTFANDSLPELVILKNIYDGFYQEEFSNEGLLAILDSLRSDTKISEHKFFAEQIREEVTRLMKGFPAPGFALPNITDSIIELKTLKGKYVYLCFCSARSYPCMEQISLLSDLLKKYSEKLSIVIVMADSDYSVVKKFAQNYGFEGIVLIAGTRNDLFKQYKIKAYPTYYLIDPDGNFVLSPAPSPIENFESGFRNILLSSQK